MKSVSWGFSLMELLVVISLISLLSSVVFSSLSSARLKAKDAVVRETMWQLRTLIESSYISKGDYSDWQAQIASGPCDVIGVYPNLNYYCDMPEQSTGDCGGAFSGAINTPSAEGQTLCQKIVDTIGDVGVINVFVIGVPWNTPLGSKNYYSVMAYLPSKNKYLCIGNSGMSEVNGLNYGLLITHNSSEPVGCFRNP